MLKQLYDAAAVAAGESSAKARTAGRDSVYVLLDFTSIGGGVFEPWCVFDTPDGPVEAQMYQADPSAAAWRLSNFDATYAYYVLPVTGSSWIYFKLVGGTGATGVSLYVDAGLETS